jgi:hypothetical protein
VSVNRDGGGADAERSGGSGVDSAVMLAIDDDEGAVLDGCSSWLANSVPLN